jgi:1-phosphatidylinositol-3-phosphate 5-kinase
MRKRIHRLETKASLSNMWSVHFNALLFFLLKFHILIGQVFCSRCASNIIKGLRFGHDGMIRVCNLCLEKLSKVDDDDDDDKRSIVSSINSPFTNHQITGDSFTLGLSRHSQSPFAASQLFGRKDEPFNLFSIAETKQPTIGSDGDHIFSRASTPQDNTNDLAHPVAAPFRRTLAVDETDPIAIPNGFGQDHSPPAPGSKTPVDFPITVPVSVDGAISSVMFPASPPDYGAQQHGVENAIRSRFNSYADFDLDTPFIRSRAQSRIPECFMGEPGWRTRRESTA